MMRAFWERLIFQYLSYDDYSKPLFDRKIKTAMIYTMNAPESILAQIGYEKTMQAYERMLQAYFGNSTGLRSTETLQVADYSKYHMASFNEADRKRRRAEVFPKDCEIAYALGKSMAAAK